MKIFDNEKTFKIALVLSVILFVASVGVKFSLCGIVTVKNSGLKDLALQKIELEKEVSRLSYKESTMSSLSYIESKAKSLGFVNLDSRLLSLDPRAPVQIAAISR